MMNVSEMVMNIACMECSNLGRWDLINRRYRRSCFGISSRYLRVLFIERFVCCMTHDLE